MSLLPVADVAVGLGVAADATLLLWRRGPDRVAFLLVAVCITWFAGNLAPTLLFLHRGPMIHVHLSYPTGRLPRWPVRVAAVGGYVWALVDGWLNSPEATAVVATVVALTALESASRTTGAARRAVGPALAAALLFAGVLGLSAANQLLAWERDYAFALVYDLTVLAVTTWLALDLLRGRWTEAAIADLVVQLGRDGGTDLESTLRRALGDPGLTLAIGAVPAGPPRAATAVSDGDRVIATLLHDPLLTGNPRLLAGAVEAVRLAVANGLLREEVEEHARVLAAARGRLLEVADEQRSRLGEAIDRGPVRDLDAAAAALQARAHDDPTQARVDALVDEITATRDLLVGFASGLRPSVKGDLDATLRRTLGQLGVPVVIEVAGADELPAPVSLAIWFLCSEAVTNAVKHAGASVIRVRVSVEAEVATASVTDDGRGGVDIDGSGVQGLVHRIAAVGGTVDVDSRPGVGTVVTARVPVVADSP